MREEDKWPAMHAYRKAVAIGDAPVILCPDCESELVPVVGTDGGPWIKCLGCRVSWKPGMNVWSQIIANISEAVWNVKEKEKEIE